MLLLLYRRRPGYTFMRKRRSRSGFPGRYVGPSEPSYANMHRLSLPILRRQAIWSSYYAVLRPVPGIECVEHANRVDCRELLGAKPSCDGLLYCVPAGENAQGQEK